MSWIAKRMLRSNFEMMNQEHMDADALAKGWAEDGLWDVPSELGVGQSIKGRKAIADWFRGWEQEFPKRKMVLNNVCLKGSFLPSPNNVIMVSWTCIETDRQGREYRYDGASTIHIKNMKATRLTEHISFKGLPKVSDLVKPMAKA